MTSAPATCRDWTIRNLVFIDDAWAAHAAHILTSHLHAATEIIVDALPCANLYLSGSIARGEPAFRCRGDRVVGLQSDLDFVLVGDVDQTMLDMLERRLQMTFPEFRDTLYRFTADQVPCLRSASARDLHLGLSRPLHEAAPLEALEPFDVEAAHALEILVYQIVAALADRAGERPTIDAPVAGGIWHADPPYRLHKLAVEALRAATCALGEPFSRTLMYRSVYEHRCGPRLGAIAEESRIVDLLARRERWTGASIGWSDELARIVHRSIAVTRRLPVTTSPVELLDDVIEAFELDCPMHAYAASALAAFYTSFACAGHGRLATLERMLMARLSANWPSSRAVRPASLAQAVVALRWEYIAELTRLKDGGISLWSIDRRHVR